MKSLPRTFRQFALAFVIAMSAWTPLSAGDDQASAPELVKSAQSGAWSQASTWENGKIPAAGDRVQIRTGHEVAFDVESDEVIRSIHVAGQLVFARDRNTRLNVGLIKIQAGDDASE